MTIRTSVTDPIRIAHVPAGQGGIGIAFCPGKSGASMTGPDWARDLDADLDAIRQWGAEAVISLIEPHELEEMQVQGLGTGVTARGMEWHHLPITDVSVPDGRFEDRWRAVGPLIRASLSRGDKIFIHCKGGLGRAGTVAARLLVELGQYDAVCAIAAVREARPGALETRDQERHVEAIAARLDRAAGCLLGLAIGDAIGTSLEFKKRDSYKHLTDMVGGGPFHLPVGVWTDDTSMALALADSLIASKAHGLDFDANDLMDRFVSWWREGEYSATGECFDIGITTSSALGRYKASGDPFAGDPDPHSAGNGSLMRLAPVALAGVHWSSERAAEIARLQSRTTHAAAACLDACAAYALMLRAVITGANFEEAIDAGQGRYGATIGTIVEGSWRAKSRDGIASSGYVAHSLEAALWCLARTDNYRDAVLLAANLGDDADTTAAITGQLAGALYGRAGLPTEWLAKLAWRERIEAIALDLVR